MVRERQDSHQSNSTCLNCAHWTPRDRILSSGTCLIMKSGVAHRRNLLGSILKGSRTKPGDTCMAMIPAFPRGQIGGVEFKPAFSQRQTPLEMD